MATQVRALTIAINSPPPPAGRRRRRKERNKITWWHSTAQIKREAQAHRSLKGKRRWQIKRMGTELRSSAYTSYQVTHWCTFVAPVMCVTVFGSSTLRGANELWTILVTGYLHTQRRISRDVNTAIDQILMLGILYGTTSSDWRFIKKSERYVVTLWCYSWRYLYLTYSIYESQLSICIQSAFLSLSWCVSYSYKILITKHVIYSSRCRTHNHTWCWIFNKVPQRTEAIPLSPLLTSDTSLFTTVCLQRQLFYITVNMLTILQVFPQYCSWISRIYMPAWPRLTFNGNAYQLDPMEKEKKTSYPI